MEGVIRPDTRNTVDGGVQCSALGSDVLNIPKPTFEPIQSITFKDCAIKAGDSSHTNLLVPNQAMKKVKKIKEDSKNNSRRRKHRCH